MKIKYLAHSAFLITSASGIRIITDPYTVGGDIHYDKIDEPADIIIMTHDHFDHNDVRSVPGTPEVIIVPDEAKGIRFRCVPTHHDDSGGSQRGMNNVFCFEVDGVNICHAGDLGHVLRPGQIEDIGGVDVLFIPVGGYYTIDAAQASRVCEQLKPKVIIPMHYKTPKLDFPIKGVEEFTKGKKNVTRSDASEVELTADKLPTETRIMVLEPSR